MVLVVFLAIKSNVYWPKNQEIVTGSYYEELPILETFTGLPIELEFYLYTYQNGLVEQDTVEIKLIEVQDKDIQKIQYASVYPRCNGTFRIEFRKDFAESQIYIQIDKKSETLGNYRIALKRLLAGNKVLYMDRDYHMLNDEEIVDHLYMKWEDNDQLTYESKVFRPNYQISKERHWWLFKVETIVYNKENVIITYSVLENIEEDYIIWLYGNPDILNNIDKDRYLQNYEYYSPTKSIETSSWEKGEKYNIVYEMPRHFGWYRLVGGISNKGKTRITDDNTGFDYVVFGWFEASKY